ncbi:DUF4232 domain-containing protein [Streptomyces sp. NPDC058960]|uniref:DUF4232 domain-containing protein n=1 Tax=Streptomyces sp. NPDC058960 TaxID=3346679 RepID=UPI003682CD05
MSTITNQRSPMRALPVRLAVTAFVAALALTACDSSGNSGSADKSGDSGKSKNTAECTLGIKVGPANAATTAGDTGDVPVTLTNDGSRPCAFDGFPGIELTGGDTGWKVPDQEGANPEKVTLQKGDTATFTITYVRGKAGGTDSAAAKNVKITVPGAGDAHSYPWSYGEVALKGGKTPDASVSPIQVAGD